MARALQSVGAAVELATIPRHIEIPDWSEFGRSWQPQPDPTSRQIATARNERRG